QPCVFASAPLRVAPRGVRAGAATARTGRPRLRRGVGQGRLPGHVGARERRGAAARRGRGLRRPHAAYRGRDDIEVAGRPHRSGLAPGARERLPRSAPGDGHARRHLPHAARRRRRAADGAEPRAGRRQRQGRVEDRLDAGDDPPGPYRGPARPHDPTADLARPHPRARRHRARHVRGGRGRRRRPGPDPLGGGDARLALVGPRHEGRRHQGEVHAGLGEAGQLRADPHDRGLEATLDDELGGSYGFRLGIVEADERPVETLAETPAIAGRDVVLSLDPKMQAAAEKALGDRKGAIVAEDPWSGEILALASRPSFDLNAFAGGETGAVARYTSDPNRPLFNRATFGQYATGSSFKPVTAAAALREGLYKYGDRID